jgi:tetratricopeptide (TPR) repeat protein
MFGQNWWAFVGSLIRAGGLVVFASVLTSKQLNVARSRQLFPVPYSTEKTTTPEDNAQIWEATNPILAGRFAEAIQAWAPRIAANPNDAQLAYSLATVYLRLGRYKQGIFYARLACKDNPSEIRYKWMLRAQTTMAGLPESSIPPEYRLQVPPGAPSPVRFLDVTTRARVENFALGRGVAWGDFDRDGYDDLLVCAERAPFRLFRNLGNGQFVDVSKQMGLIDPVGLGCYAANFIDYDNDGLEDIFLTSNGWGGTNRLFLFHNEKGHRFVDVTKTAGLGDPINAFGASWADYNNDGNLDVAVAAGIAQPSGGRLRLFRNNGDGTFSDVSLRAGLAKMAQWISVCWGDYNGDGLPDLFAVSFDKGCDLYQNLGNGQFKEVSEGAGIECPTASYTCEFLDYNNDGQPDVFVSTYPWKGVKWGDLKSMVEDQISGAPAPPAVRQLLFRNNGDGTFTRVSEQAGLIGLHGGMASQVADIDNDGYPDILLGTGNPQLDWTEPKVLYHNDEDGRFTNVAPSAGLNNFGMLHGIAFSDYNDSGDLSFYGSFGGFYWGSRDKAHLYRNNGSGEQALEVYLIGTRSNRDAIGVRLVARVGKRTVYQYLDGGSGFGSMNSRILHVGLGTSEIVNSLEIDWPSGIRQKFFHIAGGQRIRIVEGVSGFKTISRFKRSADMRGPSWKGEQ